jgi:hypothetical protein
MPGLQYSFDAGRSCSPGRWALQGHMNIFKSTGWSWILRAVAVGAALGITVPASAQGLPKEPGPARTAKMFDLICLSKLPDIKSIAALATSNKFDKLEGKALARYRPQAPVDQLHGWRFTDFGATYTLLVTSGQPDAQFKAQMPAYANSVNYACSLILPNKFAKAAVLAAFGKIVGRKHDDAWDQGRMQVHAWKATTDKFFIQAFHYAGKTRPNSSLLSATMFVKK